jgi:hypothetical protein
MPRQPEPFHPPDLRSMVAVASGPGPRVGRWASALRSAGIPATVTRPCDADGRDYAELWVRRGDADRAREAIEGTGFTDECPLW